MNRPQLYAGRVQVALYLEPEVFDKLETKRGKTSRNAYLATVVKNVLGEA